MRGSGADSGVGQGQGGRQSTDRDLEAGGYRPRTKAPLKVNIKQLDVNYI
jgi:hypothetical protein